MCRCRTDDRRSFYLIGCVLYATGAFILFEAFAWVTIAALVAVFVVIAGAFMFFATVAIRYACTLTSNVTILPAPAAAASP